MKTPPLLGSWSGAGILIQRTGMMAGSITSVEQIRVSKEEPDTAFTSGHRGPKRTKAEPINDLLLSKRS